MRRHRLVRERKKRKLTQQQVAEHVGYETQSAVSDIENGLRNPSLSAMKLWAELFGTTVDELWFSDAENGDTQCGDPSQHAAKPA